MVMMYIIRNIAAYSNNSIADYETCPRAVMVLSKVSSTSVYCIVKLEYVYFRNNYINSDGWEILLIPAYSTLPTNLFNVTVDKFIHPTSVGNTQRPSNSNRAQQREAIELLQLFEPDLISDIDNADEEVSDTNVIPCNY